MLRLPLFPILLATALLLSACDRDDGIKVYKVSKPADLPAVQTASTPAPGSQDMANTPVPTPPPSAETPWWNVPPEWTQKAPGAMRQASFSAGADGKVDIAVTAFPGDVGGDLANVNRWRGQLQMAPIDEATLARQIQPLPSQDAEIKMVELEGLDASTLAGWTLHHGQSWFFKMTGPKDAVAAEKARFQAFLQSVAFHP